MKVLDLFSGIGGWTLGLEWAGGFETVAFCEINPFCRGILESHWPDIPIIEDVHDVSHSTLRSLGIDVSRIDVITAGFPCQPVSNAGNMRGVEDDRWLWPEVARIIRLVRPRYILLENVPGLLTVNKGAAFAEVLGDMAACGYDAEWQVIPASALGAWHRRDRVWIVAYPQCHRFNESGAWTGARHQKRDDSPRRRERQSELYEAVAGAKVAPHTSADGCIRQSRDEPGVKGEVFFGAELIGGVAWQRGRRQWATEPSVGRLVHGVSGWSYRDEALGNAVVPQCAMFIGGLVKAHDVRRRSA